MGYARSRRNWPTDLDQVRSLLGLCAFYQCFVPFYAHIAAPLYALLRKKALWKWGPAEEETFCKLREQMLQAPVLAIADPARPYVVQTDASNLAIVATLSQVDDNGHLRLIACRSKKLTPSELNYQVHKKQAYA